MKKAPKKSPKKTSKKAPKKALKKAPERDSYHLPARSEQEQISVLSEDLQEAWKVLRKYLISLGPQEIRTSHTAIMFARKTCYVFVRTKKKFLELNVFLPRIIESEFVRKATAVSKTKYVHIVQVVHPDQIEEPLTDWLRDAFEYAA